MVRRRRPSAHASASAAAPLPLLLLFLTLAGLVHASPVPVPVALSSWIADHRDVMSELVAHASAAGSSTSEPYYRGLPLQWLGGSAAADHAAVGVSSHVSATAALSDLEALNAAQFDPEDCYALFATGRDSFQLVTLCGPQQGLDVKVAALLPSGTSVVSGDFGSRSMCTISEYCCSCELGACVVHVCRLCVHT